MHIRLITCILLALGSHLLPAQRFWEHPGPFVNFPDVINPVEKAGYKLVFQDEFDGPGFRDELWNRQNYFNGSSDAASAVDNLYHVYPDPVAQGNYAFRQDGTNGYLQMIARKQLPPMTMWTSQQTEGYNLGAELRPYTTAAIESWAPFKYGYLEARIKLPEGGNSADISMWPALWFFYHSDAYFKEGRSLEIDVFEIMTNCPRIWLTNVWSYGWECACSEVPYMDPLGGSGWDGFSCARNASFFLDPGQAESFSSKFWTYGLEWDSDRVHFFLNNVLVRSITRSCLTPQVFSKLILNLGVTYAAPNMCGNTGGEMPQSATMEVDYVRFYKRILAPELGMAPLYGAWHPNRHRRMLGDVDGDRRADVLAFGNAQVSVGLGVEGATGLGFQALVPVIDNLSALQGWNPRDYPIMTGDVNGDRKTDVIGFGGSGIFLYVADGVPGQAHFREIGPTFPYFGSDLGAGGYQGNKRQRLVGDVNGDGKDDVVGCTDKGVVVALANPTTPGFLAPVQWTGDFGAETGSGAWNSRLHRRKLVDVDGDGRKDMVGFHDAAVWVGLSTGNGFASAEAWLSDYCAAQGWNLQDHLVLFGDVNGDGRQDIVGFGEQGCSVALSEGDRFGAAVLQWADMGAGASAGDWSAQAHPRKVGDVTGDGLSDVIGFGRAGVYLAEAALDGAGVAYLKAPRLWYNEMGSDASAGGWSNLRHVRLLADLDGDRVLDVAGFGEEGLYGHKSPHCKPFDPCGPDFNAALALGFQPADTLQARFAFDGTALGAPGLSAVAFPNPSDGLYTVEIAGQKDEMIEISVVNALGMELTGLQQSLPGSGALKLDLRGLPEGIYFLVMRQGKSKVVLKLVYRQA